MAPLLSNMLEEYATRDICNAVSDELEKRARHNYPPELEEELLQAAKALERAANALLAAKRGRKIS